MTSSLSRLTPEQRLRLYRIVTDQGEMRHFKMRPQQEALFASMQEHRLTFCVKYRQGGITTLGALWLLDEIARHPGWHGYLIADTHETAEEAFSKINDAIEHMPEGILPRLTRSATRVVSFSHGGTLKCLTGGTRFPAIGRSVDRMVMTEVGMWSDFEGAIQRIAPAYRKRQHARILIESTPGPAGCYMETFWRQTLTGNDWNPVFLQWREDPFIAEYPGGPDAFRKVLLEGEFAGNDLLFESQYPRDELSGFTTFFVPSVPLDLIEPHLPGVVWAAPARGEGVRRYAITADPAGYGEDGDPSAVVVWEVGEVVEDVYSWTGRESPERFAMRVMELADVYGPEVVAVESNAAACVEILHQHRIPALYYTSPAHPGWYATQMKKYLALGKLIKRLRDGKIRVRGREALLQLRTFSLAESLRIEGHHHDLAICCLIAADLLEPVTVSEPVPYNLPSVAERGIPLAMYRRALRSAR